jgi:phosphoenolpyruvate---glycerone phosphotransferase subunit DhaL
VAPRGSFADADGGIILLRMIEAIHDNAKGLSEIDGAAGDGDHGINMDKGFMMCADRLRGKPTGFSGGLAVLGEVLLSEIGGSLGPLYGTLFLEMAAGAAGAVRVDAETLGRMLDRALAAVTDVSGARIGDKTMMDALVPAVDAYRKAVAGGGAFADALGAMRDAAQRGKESTRDMIARVGRSSRLGERSRGMLDAGATSCALLLSVMADAMIELAGKAG